MKQVLGLAMALAMGMALSSCELAGGLANGPTPVTPTIQLSENALIAHPSVQQIAAFYCPQIIGDPITRAACAVTLGPPPPKNDMQFHFELRYKIANPNNFPIPTTEILAAIDVFEGFDKSELGAICVVLCAEGDPECTGAPGENSCKDQVGDIYTIEDVANRVVDLLILTVDAAINDDFDNLAQRILPATSENVEIRVRFSLGIDAMVDLMAIFVDQLVQDFLGGKEVAFEIPYSVRGTLWVQIPILGRVAIGYGPLSDVWVINP